MSGPSKILALCVFLLLCYTIVLTGNVKKYKKEFNNSEIEIMECKTEIRDLKLEIDYIIPKVNKFLALPPVNQYKLINYVERSNYLSHSDTQYILEEVYKYDEPLLLLAIIHTESSFNKRALSNKDAYGLMQIRWPVWRYELMKFGIMNDYELYDIRNNLMAGNYIITKYINESDTLDEALYKYSGGSTEYSNKVLTELQYILDLLEGNVEHSLISINKLEIR